jgi:shikimate dehydrogenase
LQATKNLQTLQLGLIGLPLQHSLSPVLHTTALQYLGTSGTYQLYEVETGALPNLLDTLQASGLRGVNVTIPHKLSVLDLVDWKSPEVLLAGAANTLVFEADGTRKAYNTDITGLKSSFPASFKHNISQKQAIVLGAGGSARAVMIALIEQQIASIQVVARSPEKAQKLVECAQTAIAHYKTGTQVCWCLPQQLTVESLQQADALFNTTPVGMWPNEEGMPLFPHQVSALPQHGMVYDLVYRPLKTTLLTQASQQNCLTVSGLEMLLYQGIAALELWQPQTIDAEGIAIIRQALQNGLT